MYKLQVVLVPPGFSGVTFTLPTNPPTADNSQVLPPNIVSNGSTILGANRPELGQQTGSSNNLFMSSFASTHGSTPKLRKLLHFTKPTNTLFSLAEEIVERCDKIYPNLTRPVEVLTLQDSNECDLDPDYLVKDVFNVDNVVRAVLRNDIELSDDQSQTLYSAKRRRLNSSLPNPSGQPNVLHIAKKRPHMLRNSSAMRVSTPLANQIYPPATGRQVNSDYEDDDVGDRSVLPPPQPQSQPIRISSGVGSAKKINFNEDTISRSEAVDPDKSRQQRLPSGTPMRHINNGTATTPNRLNVLDGTLQADEVTNKSSATPVATNKRITSGMLRIPEPKISEIENELRQGPASPSAELPPRPDRIPMKKQQFPQSDDEEQSQSSGNENPTLMEKANNLILEHGSKPSASRQTSIADNNGSPIKDGNKIGNVNLAELPQVGRRITRKSSLESKVESLIKSATNLSEEARGDLQRLKDNSNNAIRKDTFSEEDDMEDQLPEDPNDTVRVNHLDNSGNSSFQKSELLSMLKGNKFNIPSDFNKRSLRSNTGYVETGGNKISINSTDAKNQRQQRGAARKASRLLSSGKSKDQEESSESDEESSGIETDRSENGRVTVIENQALRKLNIHPLKERVIGEGGEEASQVEISPSPKNDKKTGQTSESGSSAVKSRQKTSNTSRSTSASSETSSSETSASSEEFDKTRDSVKSPRALSKSVTREEISTKLMKGISPAPGDRETRTYQSPEFIEDSDEDMSTNETKSSNAVAGDSKPVEKKLAPSILKRREEAEKKRQQRQAIKKAREEEAAKKKAEKEARRREKEALIAQKKAEREAKRKAKEEGATRKKLGRDLKSTAKGSRGSSKRASAANSTAATHEKADDKVDPAQNADDTQDAEKVAKKGVPSESTGTKDIQHGSDNLKPQDLAQYFNTGDKSTQSSPQNGIAAESPSKEAGEKDESKLARLKSQFTSGQSAVAENPKSSSKDNLSKDEGKAPSDASISDVPDADSSSNDNDSSGDDSSDDESAGSRKSRRGIVDTPKGAIISLPKRGKKGDLSGVENAPQSTQQGHVSTSAEKTPAKVPVTRMMEMSSPVSLSNSNSPPKASKKPESKPSRSLSSLSDLVSRGVPEVKDLPVNGSKVPLNSTSEKGESNNDQSQEESDQSDSEEDSDSSTDDSSDGQGSNFISAKSASKALGRNKSTNSGFASLVKDSKKN